jgi:hypothetical protein
MKCSWRRFLIQDVQKETQPMETPYSIVIQIFYFCFTGSLFQNVCLTGSLFQNDYDHQDLQTLDYIIYFYGDF